MVKTTYLQMFIHPQRVVPAPRDGIAIVHAKKPPVAYYRFLYDAVRRENDWTSRRKLSDAELAADPRTQAHSTQQHNDPRKELQWTQSFIPRSMPSRQAIWRGSGRCSARIP